NTAVTTLGGMLAVDAAGSHSVRVGSTRDHVESIETVLADGSTVEFADEPLTPPGAPRMPLPDLSAAAAANGSDSVDVKQSIVRRLAALLAENQDVIRRKQPALIRNCAGYYVRGLLTATHLHVPRLLAGS